MRHLSGSRRAAGMSMIELLIAMVIGLFLIGGAISLFVTAKRSYTESEQTARMGENGRFALQVISMDLRHAGFFGEAAPPGIDPDSGLNAVSGDCSGRAAAYDVRNYLFVARSNGSGVAIGCITDAVPDTDVIVIKSVRPRPLSDGARDDASDDDGTIDTPEGLSAQKTYVMSNAIRGLLFDGADTAPTIRIGGEIPGGNAWEYRFQAYYIRNGNVPTLSRKVIAWNGTAMAVTTEDVVDGIENLRVRIGVDSDDNGEVDSYVDSQAANIKWDRVQSIETYLLVRGIDQDPAYLDARTYRLGSDAITPGGHLHRTVVRGAVSLRNAKLLIRGNI